MSTFAVIAFGVLGGFLMELLGHYKLRQQAPDAFPQYLKSPYYWVVTVLMILSGGVLPYVYVASGIELKPILAVNIGASAPLIISTLIRQEPPKVD